jgi:hypothetical protein
MLFAGNGKAVFRRISKHALEVWQEDLVAQFLSETFKLV